MRCGKCGREIDDRSAFCGYCGQAVPPSRPGGQQPGQQRYPGGYPYDNRYDPARAQYPAPKKRREKGMVVLIVVFAVILALLLLFASLFLLVRSGRIDADRIPLIGALSGSKEDGPPAGKERERDRSEESEEVTKPAETKREEASSQGSSAAEKPAATVRPTKPAATERPTPAPTPTPTPTTTLTPAPTPEPAYYILPNSGTDLISEADLKALTARECALARNEIFARHGRIFNNAAIREYFESQSWYHGTIPADQFDFNKELSYIEQKNIETILNYEKKTYGGSYY